MADSAPCRPYYWHIRCYRPYCAMVGLMRIVIDSGRGWLSIGRRGEPNVPWCSIAGKLLMQSAQAEQSPNQCSTLQKLDKCGMTGKNFACPAADSAEVVERSDKIILRR